MKDIKIYIILQKEKQQLYVRYKSLENSHLDNMTEDDQVAVSSIGITKLYDNMSEFIESYEESMEKKKEIKSKQRKTTKKKKASSSNNILQFASNLTEEEKL